jgi:hypothetical protein
MSSVARSDLTSAGPIFIGGLDRTGTSLVYALLASHPSIAMTRRTNWWSYFYDRFGDLAEDRNLDRCLATMARYRRHRRLNPDLTRIRSDFVRGARTYGRLFELLETQYAERLGKPRWGDKSLHTERYASRVFADFPSARIVHMVRDPRDRYASVVRRWKRVRGGVGAGTAAWLASLELAERNVAAYPGRYMILRYEDLAARPAETLQTLCAFVGEPFDQRMLAMDAADDFRSTGGNSSYGQFAAGSISTRSIGKFRDVLRPAEVAFIQGRAGRVMRKYGYHAIESTLSPRERLRYLVRDRPLATAKLYGWRARERIRDLLGRSPSDETLSEVADPIKPGYVSNE